MSSVPTFPTKFVLRNRMDAAYHCLKDIPSTLFFTLVVRSLTSSQESKSLVLYTELLDLKSMNKNRSLWKKAH